jgi:hypothetical protein
MTKVDHIALVVDNPLLAAKWYESDFNAEILYSDEAWAIVQFENIKMAFVMKGKHPAHFAFEVEEFDKDDKVKKHRDGSNSVYKKDPWGNIYELINYEE